jgi:hypothetical protein
MMRMKRCGVRVASTWAGEPIGPDEAVALELSLAGDRLAVELQAPFHGDPAPGSAPGSCPGLWDYEVVELFLLGADDRYVEIELGPHGHFLVLTLQGARNRVAEGHALDYSFERRGGRWQAAAELSTSLLPADLERFNAYAIHGSGGERRYLAAYPVGGAVPDFHRLSAFGPLNWHEAGA